MSNLKKANKMKKYILLLFSVFAFGQASNQMVTFTQAQSLGFSLKSGQSHVTSNQCMTKADILAKYNVTISGYADNQLVPRSAWVSAIVSFSGNLIVGNTSSYWGYFLGGISAGSMNPNNDISMVAGTSAVIQGLYYHRDDGTLIFHIQNASSTLEPVWTSMKINGVTHDKSSFTFGGYNSFYSYWEWVKTSSNVMGTTVGASRTIELF